MISQCRLHTQEKTRRHAHAHTGKNVAAYAMSFSFPAGITGLTGCELSDAEDVNGGHK